jgi:hypothetical protein
MNQNLKIFLLVETWDVNGKKHAIQDKTLIIFAINVMMKDVILIIHLLDIVMIFFLKKMDAK